MNTKTLFDSNRKCATSFEALYIHLPFCRSICPFCHFAVKKYDEQSQDHYYQYLLQEIELWSKRIENQSKLTSIYFGGGTPSLMPIDKINGILERVSSYFDCDPCIQISLEANPEELNEKWLSELEQSKINRLSLGIQSLNKNHLDYLGRYHDEVACYKALSLLKESSIDDFSVDYMFGYPHLESQLALEEINFILQSNAKHISLYCLNVEKKTPFDKNKFLKQWIDENEKHISDCYLQLKDKLQTAGLEQYEISNFAEKRYQSKQNHIYWQKKGYLGLGNSAHSYFNGYRWSNLSKIHQWSEQIKQKMLPIETIEKLSKKEQLDEYLMINLRLISGLNLVDFNQKFQIKQNNAFDHCLALLQKKELIHLDQNQHLKLSNQGQLLADEITLNISQALTQA